MSADARTAAPQAIDNTVYGLMQLQGGVTDPLAKGDHYATLRTEVRLRRSHDDAVLHAWDVLHVDGMCMGWHGWHGWIEGDFGDAPLTHSYVLALAP